MFLNIANRISRKFITRNRWGNPEYSEFFGIMVIITHFSIIFGIGAYVISLDPKIGGNFLVNAWVFTLVCIFLVSFILYFCSPVINAIIRYVTNGEYDPSFNIMKYFDSVRDLGDFIVLWSVIFHIILLFIVILYVFPIIGILLIVPFVLAYLARLAYSKYSKYSKLIQKLNENEKEKEE